MIVQKSALVGIYHIQ